MAHGVVLVNKKIQDVCEIVVLLNLRVVKSSCYEILFNQVLIGIFAGLLKVLTFKNIVSVKITSSVTKKHPVMKTIFHPIKTVP